MECSLSGFPFPYHLLEFVQTDVHSISDAIQPSYSLLPSSPPAFNLSQHQHFFSELALHIWWPKYWSFSISPSNKYSELISLGLTGFIFLLSKGLFKSLRQHHSSNASILQCSTFFMVQLSHLYMTTGRTTALTIWTFVSKVVSLLFNMLSRFVISFLPRSNLFLISWLQSPSAVILEPKKRNSITASTFFSSICHEVMGPGAMILVFVWVLSRLFHSPLSPSSRGSLVPLHFLPLKWYHQHIWDCWYFFQQS